MNSACRVLDGCFCRVTAPIDEEFQFFSGGRPSKDRAIDTGGYTDYGGRSSGYTNYNGGLISTFYNGGRTGCADNGGGPASSADSVDRDSYADSRDRDSYAADRASYADSGDRTENYRTASGREAPMEDDIVVDDENANNNNNIDENVERNVVDFVVDDENADAENVESSCDEDYYYLKGDEMENIVLEEKRELYYPMEEIIDARMEKKEREYSIRWDGYYYYSSPKYDSWDPESNLYGLNKAKELHNKMEISLKLSESKRYMTMSSYLLGDRVHDVVIDSFSAFAKQGRNNISRSTTMFGRDAQLLAVKVDREDTFIGPPKQTMHLHYVTSSSSSGREDNIGKEIPLPDLSKELLKLADFSRLSPRKVKARLELLLSPAITTSKSGKPMIFDELTAEDDFEEIDEVAHEGCGFIPRSYLERFFGLERTIGKHRIFAIQVQIFAPRLGIFKGMLCEKPGIDKIQLPSSMKKVEPSTKREGPFGSSRDWACLLVCRLHGSREKNASAVIHDDPGKFESNELKEMMQLLWKGCGVSDSVLERYVRNRDDGRPQLRHHANVVGLADPTGKIPPGRVFVTGAQDNASHFREEEELFVSRYPCTEVCDAHMLPRVISKPASMSKQEWNWLEKLPFGAIIFGNPKEGRYPLPSMIARGHLDGDLYFICWDATIIAQTKRFLKNDVHYPLENATRRIVEETKTPVSSNPYWFEDGQDIMVDVNAMVDLNILIGKLYSQWKREAKEEGKTIQDGDASAFGRAYKDALDIDKHGGKIELPRHLWCEIPARLHRYLR